MAKKKKQKKLGRLKLYFLYPCLLFSFIFLFSLYKLYHKLPDVEQLRQKSTQPLIHFYDNQNHLFKTYGDYGSNYATYDEFPKHLIDALVATEDKRFFQHHGIDFFSIPRAFLINIFSFSYVQGASTISQQLAKMLFLNSDKTLSRKIKEALLAFKIEQNFSKYDILEMYLNKAYYGSGNYGIVSAAKDYFDKEVRDLSLNEAALLVGLLKAPSKYSPKRNPELSHDRTNIVLEQMFKYNFITEESLVIAQYQDNAWNQGFTNTDNYKYFTDWLMSDLSEQSEIFPFNLKVKTTYDEKVHRVVDQTITEFYSQHPELESTQIATVVMRLDGAIMSMVGGKNYKKSQYNRTVYAKRQPGSAFKLFVYLEALKQGYKNEDTVIDQPIDIDGWQPQNYDQQYRGEMTLREAFVRSINSVSALLANEVGLENIIKAAHDMGIKSDLPNLPSISLGTAELSLLELASAYGVVANGGKQVEPYGIESIRDDYNNLLFEKQTVGSVQVLDKELVEKISNLLHGVVVWGTGKAAQVEGLTVKGKTGTSQDYRDAWFIGFTDDVIIGVWIGNDDNSSLGVITGGSYPARIFSRILQQLYY